MAGPQATADHPRLAPDHDIPQFRVAPDGAPAVSARADETCRELSMKRYTAHMGFAIFAIWIAVVFVLASTVTN